MGEWWDYLKLNFLSMTGDDQLRFAKEITKGIMYLHKKGILHRDLVISAASANIFIIGKIYIELFQRLGSQQSNNNC